MSLHAVFVERGGALDLARFAAALGRALRAHCGRVPRARWSRRHRAVAVIATRRCSAPPSARARVRVRRATPHLLVVEPPRDEPPPLLPAHARAVRASMAPRRWSRSCARHALPLEAVAVADPAGRRDVLDAVVACGAVRIARFGTLQAPSLAGEHGGIGRDRDVRPLGHAANRERARTHRHRDPGAALARTRAAARARGVARRHVPRRRLSGRSGSAPTARLVTDADGNRFLDLTSAFGVALTGHANPRVAEAIAAQAARLAHGMGDVHPTELKTRLLDRLAAMAPLQDARGFLCSSGAEAVEFALKTALLATGRPNALAFEGSYHGLAHGALEVTGIARFRAPFLAQLRNATTFVPYPATAERGATRALEAVDAALRDDPSIGAVDRRTDPGPRRRRRPARWIPGRPAHAVRRARRAVDRRRDPHRLRAHRDAVRGRARGRVARPAMPRKGARGRLPAVGGRRERRRDGRVAAVGGGGAAHLDVPRQPDGLCGPRSRTSTRSNASIAPGRARRAGSGSPRGSRRSTAGAIRDCAGAERYGASYCASGEAARTASVRALHAGVIVLQSGVDGEALTSRRR